MNVMKKKWYFAIMVSGIMIVSSACSAGANETVETEAGQKTESGQEAETGPETTAEQETQTDPAGALTEDDLYPVYGEALWNIYYTGEIQGIELEYTGVEAAGENHFSIMDIDGDGKEELLLSWENTSMAGMQALVLGYGDGEIYVELSEFPDLTFYDNGMVEAGWSHNQGVGSAWPYDVYCYDEETDTYLKYGSVDSWDRSISEENYGTAFPTELDADGDGIVYYIYPADWDWEIERMNEYLTDGAEYESWRSAWLSDAQEIPISWELLTEEAIAALGYPKPDVEISEPAG